MSVSASLSPAHESFLENGLKVVIVPAHAAPVATLMVLYRVGSRNEAVGYTGASHLLEHMLFKGTPANNRGNGRAFADIMNEIGANKNATTWLDRTNYFETVPIGYLDFAIELEADRMRGAFIADADRRAEMTVVRNELERHDNSSARVLNAALVAAAFREHPYHHPTIGWRSDVEGVSTERLRELYDTFYHPDNATVFVIGDVEVERTLGTLERTFGALPRANAAIPDVYTEEPPQTGERGVVLKRPGETTILSYAYHTPAALGQRTVLSAPDLARRAAEVETCENDSYALDVLARILGYGKTSRLSRALVDTGLALDASAWNWGSRDPGLLQIVVNVRPGVSVDKVRRKLDRVLDKLASDGPKSKELARVRRQIEVQRAFARDGTYALAQRLAEFEAVGTWRIDESYVARVAAVTADDVRAAMRAHVHEDNRTVGTLLPGTARTFDVVPFEPVDTERPAAAVEAAPLPEPTSARTSSFADRVARGVLSNGVTWSYVRAGENPTVALRGIAPAGRAFSPGRPLLPAIVAEMLPRGTRARPRREIEERLERAGIRRAYGVDDEAAHSYDPLAFRFAAACEERDLPLLLETLGEELAAPAFHELKLVKADLSGSLRIVRTNTTWRAMQRFAQLVYEDGDPNAAADCDALLEEVAATTLDDVRDFHARVVLAAPPIVSAAGSVDEDEFARLLERTLGGVPFAANGTREVAAIRAREPRDVFERVELERKANVDIVIGRATPLVRASDDYFAAIVANGILGQSTLSSRLGLRLRDREGLTYGVTSGFASPGRIPGPWRVGVSVNPANVERAIASVRDELRAYNDSGPTARELAQQKRSMAGQHHVNLATAAGIAVQLERMAYFDLGDDYVDSYGERLAAVSAADVREAIARYLGERDLAVVAAGTFAES